MSQAVRAYIHNAALEASQNGDPSPSIVIDPIELEKFICDLESEKKAEKEKLETKLEKAENMIVRLRYLALDAMHRGLESINKDTHKEKDCVLQQSLLVLSYLVKKSYESLDKSELDEVPF